MFTLLVSLASPGSRARSPIWLNRRITRYHSYYHPAQSARCCAFACIACFAGLLYLASSATGGARFRSLFRQPPPPRCIPPSDSIGALTRYRSHRLFRQPPPPRCIRHRRRFGYGATGGASATEPQAALRLRSIGHFKGGTGGQGGVNPEGERSEHEACVGVAGAGGTLD